MARFRILDQTSHSHVQFRKRRVIHVHWTGNGPESRRCVVGINFLCGNCEVLVVEYLESCFLDRSILSFKFSFDLVFVSLSLVFVHVLFSCLDLLFLLVLDFMLSSRIYLLRGTLGFPVLGFFSCGISVILILRCGIAVSSSSAVCGFSSFWLTRNSHLPVLSFAHSFQAPATQATYRRGVF